MPLRPEEVRIYVKDNPRFNRLIDGEEYTNEHIQLCMELAVDDFNTVITPFTYFRVEDFPYKSLHMLGTLKHLFLGAGAGKTRNRLAFATGGTSVDVESQAPQYLQMATQLEAEFTAKASNIKKHLNVESGWGTIYSEYSQTGYYYNRTSRKP